MSSPADAGGCVYRLTCIPTGKSYVGQTELFIWHKDKWAEYGTEGRFTNHVRSASSEKSTNTPINQVIRMYGRDAFNVETICYAKSEDLDALETAYIKHYNTVVPNGYNVAKHGRKNTDATSLAYYFSTIATSVWVRCWKREGMRQAVEVHVTLNDGEIQRMTFGASHGDTYENAVAHANNFLAPFQRAQIPITISPWIFGDDPLNRHQKQLDFFKGKVINRILISFSKDKRRGEIVLLTVHFQGDLAPTSKMVTFTMRESSLTEKYQLALEFIRRLPTSPTTTITDNVKPEIEVRNRQLPLRLGTVSSQTIAPGVSQTPVP